MTTTSKRIKSVPYEQVLKQRFREDPDEAIDYLNAMLEAPDEPELFLRALRKVADAFGMSHLADLTGLGRESLYKTLSENGNPKLATLMTLLDAMGLQLAVMKKHPNEEPSAHLPQE